MRRILFIAACNILFINLLYCEDKVSAISDIRFVPETREITYRLKKPALIRARIGVLDGPLYAAVINWQKKEPGDHKQRWDGFDLDHIIDLSGRSDIVCTFNYIADGDDVVDTRDLTATFAMADNAIGGKLPNFSINRIHKRHKREACRDVVLDVGFARALPKTKDGFFIVDEKTPVKISFRPDDEAMFRSERYGVHIFIDDVLAAGEIDGYAPYFWVFDPKHLNSGKHIIIINFAGYNDHYGVGMLPVYVKK